MKIKFFPQLTDITKAKEIEIQAPGTIAELLVLLSERYGKEMQTKLLTEDNRLHPDMIVFINGRHIEYINGESSSLSDADTVSFFSRIAGG